VKHMEMQYHTFHSKALHPQSI